MKNNNINYSWLASCVFVLFLAGNLTSCGTNSQKESEVLTDDTEQHEEPGKEAHEVEAAGNHRQNESNEEGSAESIMWMPNDQPFSGLLKLVQGDESKLSSLVSADDDGSKVLTLNLTSDNVTLLFDGTWEDLGANLKFKTEDFQGEVVIVHHFTDITNYDYVSISNSKMQLGRIVDGKDNVLDSKEKKLPTDWATLTVSSAGTHYKGLLNEQLVNHGHGDLRSAGQVGVVLEGNGKVMLKMMEVMRLSE